MKGHSLTFEEINRDVHIVFQIFIQFRTGKHYYSALVPNMGRSSLCCVNLAITWNLQLNLSICNLLVYSFHVSTVFFYRFINFSFHFDFCPSGENAIRSQCFQKQLWN